MVMVPHTWNGEEWTCTGCGHVSLDPCDCTCNARCLESHIAKAEKIEQDWQTAMEQGRRTAEALGIPVVSLCGNPGHPAGAWHPKSPEPKGLRARFVQNCRLRTWGCTCKA